MTVLTSGRSISPGGLIKALARTADIRNRLDLQSGDFAEPWGHFVRRTRLIRVGLSAVLAAVGLAVAAPSSPANAACASNAHLSISGYVYGADNRDVNVSIGFEVQDRNGHDINVDPAYSDYGCGQTSQHGGYSIYPKELNHYVPYDGVPQHTLMKNGQYTTRTWTLGNLPSNAYRVWIEVYSRGYTGSPCTTCMNPGNVTKYGYANKHFVPVGTKGLTIKLPMRCGTYGGNAGYIGGTVRTSTGAAYTLKHVYAWTTLSWNQLPSLQAWGSGAIASGSYQIKGLAPGQTYTVWAYRQDGSIVRRYKVPVYACRTTTLNLGV